MNPTLPVVGMRIFPEWGVTGRLRRERVTAARARRGRLTAPLRTLPTADGADNPSLIADLFYTEVLLPAADRHSIKW